MRLEVHTARGPRARTHAAAPAQPPPCAPPAFATSAGERHTYVPALDGVRALAVSAVLCFHGGLSALPGGFLGVDAFFVLSGYLITSLLLAEWQRNGHVDLFAFWGRRARRLLPALVVLVAAVSLAGPRLLPAAEVRELRSSAWATLLYVNNWQMVVDGDDYFARTAAPSPLEHTWSLAIEEQFYLLWPLVLLLVLRGLRPLRRLALVCLAGAAASAVALAVLHAPFDPGRAYYGTDSRGGSLLVGAALAAWLAGRAARATLADRPRARAALGAAALAAAAATVWGWTHLGGDDVRLYHGGMVAGSVAVAIVLAHIVLVPAGLTARVLSIPPLPALGRISYGVYLWHWPVFLFVNADRSGLDGIWLFGLRCLVTLMVATASYRLVEQPVRRGAVLRGPTPAVGVALAGTATCAVLVGVATAVPGPAGHDGLAPPSAGAPEEAGGLAAFRDTTPARRPARTRDGEPTGAGRPAATRTPHVHRVRPGRPVVVDVFGDSVAWSLVAGLPGHRRLDIRDRTLLGCGVTLTAPYRYFGTTYETVWRSCRPWVRLWKRAVARDDPDVAVILVGRWETMDRMLDGRWTHIGRPDFDDHLRGRLQLAITIAGAHGAKVVLATHPYNRRGEQPDGSLFPEDLPERVTAWNRLLRDVAASNPGVSVLELGARVSPDGRFTWTAGGYQLRTDGLHLTPEGVAGWIAPWLLPRLLAAAPR